MSDLNKNSFAMEKPTETIWNRNYICVFIANSLLSFSAQCVSPLISSYSYYLGAGPVIAGILTGIYFAVSCAIRPVTGPMTAKVDNRKLMILSNVLGVIIHLGYALSGSISSFLVFRLIQGLQYGLVGSLYMVIASNSLPKSKLISGISIFGIGGTIMQMIGPALGTSIRNMGIRMGSEALGYRMVFIVATVCMAICLIPSFAIKLGKKSKEELTATGHWYKNIIAVRALPAAIMTIFISISFNLYSAYMVPFSDSLGITNIGLFFTASAITSLCVRPVYGRLGDKYGIKAVLLPGLFLMMASLVIVSRAGTLPVLLTGSVVGALGSTAVYPGLQVMSIQSVSQHQYGAASNTFFFGIDIGAFLSPLLGGIIYLNSSYPTMYLSAIVPCIMAVVILVITTPYVKRWKADATSHETGDGSLSHPENETENRPLSHR